MRRTDALNGAAVALALALAVAMAGGRATPGSASPTPGGAPGPEPARRIASLSTVADQLLLELCSPRRVVAVTARSAESRDARRFEGLATIRSLDDVEEIVALAPDLVIAQNVAEPRRLQRLRDAGLRVLDLGPLDGVQSFVEDAATVGALCGAPEAGVRYGRAFERRMAQVASDVEARRSGLYLSLYGDRLFGGTRGSSYHDVLTAGGLLDAAAARYHGFPQYDVEEVLELDPDVLVTRRGMGAAICGHPALRALRACPDGVIEVDGDLLDDPGAGMLEAAEAIRDAAYPR